MKLERQQAILDYLKQNHAASVAELSRLFFISETSIRRDLDKLERSGLLRKTYGGAILLEGGNEVISLDARQQTEREAKANIARKAADCIENGDVIFLDSSSTVLAMAAHLKRFSQLSVATNGLRMACELAELPGVKVFSLGGLVAPHTYSSNGALTLRALGDMRADKLFLSPKGVDDGIYCADEEETAVRRAMMERSREVYVLCSANKLGRYAAFKLCALEEIDALICDKPLDGEWGERLSRSGVRLL